MINSSISCPDAGGNPACLAAKQAVGTNMVITGANTDICTLAIKSDGSVAINASQSVGCNIGSSPASSACHWIDFSAVRVLSVNSDTTCYFGNMSFWKFVCRSNR